MASAPSGFGSVPCLGGSCGPSALRGLANRGAASDPSSQGPSWPKRSALTHANQDSVLGLSFPNHLFGHLLVSFNTRHSEDALASRFPTPQPFFPRCETPAPHRERDAAGRHPMYPATAISTTVTPCGTSNGENRRVNTRGQHSHHTADDGDSHVRLRIRMRCLCLSGVR